MPPAVKTRLQELGGFQAAIKTVCPGIASSGSVWRASTSANLVNEATGFRFPNDGQHGYVLIADGADADRFVKTLHERAYLAGLGWIVASKRGDALVKSVVDIAVRFPERLVFEAPPNLGPGLRQDPRPATVYDLPPLDSVAACPDLDASEKADLDRRIRADKLAIAPQLRTQRTVFENERRAADAARGIDPATTEANLEKLGRHVLGPSVMLDGVDLPALVSVGDLLADPGKFDGEEFFDPIEGREYGHATAKFFAESLTIHSFAHGRTVYRLRYDYASIVAAIMAAPEREAPKVLCRLGPLADLDDGEKADLIKCAGKRFGTVPAARKMLEQAIEKRRREEAKKRREEREAAQATTSLIILAKSTPYDSAKEFINSYFTHERQPTLLHHQAVFYGWKNTHYSEIEQECMRSNLWHFLANGVRRNDDGIIVPFEPSKTNVDGVLSALAGHAQLHEKIIFPSWFSDAPVPAIEVMSCTNGLVHLPTRRLLSHTPRFINTYALDYPYDPNAPIPKLWLTFLSQLWPDDQQSIDTLQEIFGLMLTPNTSFQKIFLMIGPLRGGKGTIARVLRGVIGDANVAGPTLASLGEHFGLEALLNKQLAIIADARISGKTDVQVITERMLSISGEDGATVHRKFLKAWNGTMPTRFMILTNVLPKLLDASGTLATRFIILQLTQSFYGKEDRTLTKKLLAERAGILNWSLDGFDRLMKRGYFIMPESAQQTMKAFEDLSNPLGAFLEEHCTIGAGRRVPCDKLFEKWCVWCRANGRDFSGTAQTFGVDLRAAIPTLKRVKPRVGGDQVGHYEGLGFKPDPF